MKQGKSGRVERALDTTLVSKNRHKRTRQKGKTPILPEKLLAAAVFDKIRLEAKKLETGG